MILILPCLSRKCSSCSIDPSKYNCWKVLETVVSNLIVNQNFPIPWAMDPYKDIIVVFCLTTEILLVCYLIRMSLCTSLTWCQHIILSSPFPNYSLPLYPSETCCTITHMTMSLIWMLLKSHFYMRILAPGLALRKRLEIIWKWSVDKRDLRELITLSRHNHLLVLQNDYR